jgi:hypothetical protein
MSATEDYEGGSAPVKSERGEVGNATYPELGCSNGVVDEVREVVVELWAWWSWLRCCDVCTQAQRSNGSSGISVLCLERAKGRSGEVRRWRVVWARFSSLQASEGDVVALHVRSSEPCSDQRLPSIGHDRV